MILSDDHAVFREWLLREAADDIEVIGEAENGHQAVGETRRLRPDVVLMEPEAMTSITVTTGVAVEGRLLARNGAITLDANTITVPNTEIAPVILVSAADVTVPARRASG